MALIYYVYLFLILFIANETWTFSSNGGFNSKISLSLFKIFFYFFLMFLIHFRDLVPEKKVKEIIPQNKEIILTPKENKVLLMVKMAVKIQ
jgi:hypothetical protein